MPLRAQPRTAAPFLIFHGPRCRIDGFAMRVCRPGYVNGFAPAPPARNSRFPHQGQSAVVFTIAWLMELKTLLLSRVLVPAAGLELKAAQASLIVLF